MVLAYQVLSIVVGVGLVAVGVAVFVFGRPIVLDSSVLIGLVATGAVMLPVLPAAALAWIEPDAPEEV